MNRIGEQCFNGRSELNRVAVRYEIAGDAVSDHFRGAAMRTADDRFAFGHRLQVDAGGSSLEIGGRAENVRLPVIVQQTFFSNKTGKFNVRLGALGCKTASCPTCALFSYRGGYFCVLSNVTFRLRVASP